MIMERLKKGFVLGDGGMIFELERRGYLSAGPYTPEVVIEHPQVVRQLQTDFARAGSDVLQACTYYAHESKLEAIGMAGALREINDTATRIAREVADEYGCLVAGNLSNSWVYNPADPATHLELADNGTWRWSATTPRAIVEYVTEYFAGRRDDGEPDA